MKNDVEWLAGRKPPARMSLGLWFLFWGSPHAKEFFETERFRYQGAKPHTRVKPRGFKP